MDNDPAADFLAREQQQLADLDDVDGTIDDDAPQFVRQNGYATDPFNADSGTATTGGALNDDDFMLLDGNDASNNVQNGDLNMASSGQIDSERDYPYRPPVSTTTPESVRKWREEQSARLKAKDKAEEEKNSELREQAQKELDDWYRLWNDNFEKRKKNNREHERSVAEANSGDTGNNSDDPKQVWGRIANLCDFSSSQKATTSAVTIPGAGPTVPNKSDANTRDVSRMKSLLLQLKQKPPKQSSS